MLRIRQGKIGSNKSRVIVEETKIGITYLCHQLFLKFACLMGQDVDGVCVICHC